MEQLVLNIENKSIIPSLKRVLASIDGVSITRKRGVKGAKTISQNELDKSIEDVRKGNLRSFRSMDDLKKYLCS
jgi:hypothetical protein